MSLPRIALLTAVASTMLGCATTDISGTDRFATCEEARASVAAAGRAGLLLGPLRIHDVPTCYYGSGWVTTFEEYRTIGGERCLIGYYCNEKFAGSSPS